MAVLEEHGRRRCSRSLGRAKMAGQQSSSVIVILCLILAALMGSARGQDMTYPAAAAPGASSDLAPAPAPDAAAPASDAGAPAPAPNAAAAPAPDTNAADAAQAPAPQAEAAAAPAPGPGVDITSTAATAYRNGPPPSEPPSTPAKRLHYLSRFMRACTCVWPPPLCGGSMQYIVYSYIYIYYIVYSYSYIYYIGKLALGVLCACFKSCCQYCPDLYV